MQVVRPVAITDTEFVSSTLSEADYATWSGATTYALADRVLYQHYVYESLQAGNLNKTPGDSTSASWWLLVRPSNRWGMFDQEINTQSTASGSTLTAVVAPGVVVDSVCLLDVTGTSATVTMTDGATTVFTSTFGLHDTPIASWTDYFFEPYQMITQKVISGLPYYASAQVSVTINNTGGNAALGGFVVGRKFEIGTAQSGARAGITDYSIKKTDTFGQTTLLRRKFAKRMDVELWLENQYLKRLHSLLADLRSTPCVWVAEPAQTDRYAPLVVFGFYKDFSIDVKYSEHSLCSLQIEGMI